MRIVYLNPVGALGGAERVLLELLSELPALDSAVEPILVAGGEGPLVEEARRLGVRTRVLPLPPALASLGDSAARFGAASPTSLLARLAMQTPGLLSHAARLARLVNGLDPALVHSNGIKTHLLAAAALPRRLPQLWHLHDFLGERPLAGRALRLLRDRCSLAIANSTAVARDAREVLPPARVAVVHNGVDVDRFHPERGARADLDRLAGLPPAEPGTLRVGLVATWARWKGHDVFLRAFAQALAGSRVPMRAYLVGSPIYRTEASQFSPHELRALVAGLGLGSRVGFVPFLERCEDVFRALDVVVHASTRPEPFGMTVIEGMASGRAVVVSRAGGAAELFEHGRDALGTPPGDVAALSAALQRLAGDRTLRIELGIQARRSAEQRFNRRLTATRLLAHSRQLVSTRPLPQGAGAGSLLTPPGRPHPALSRSLP